MLILNYILTGFVHFIVVKFNFVLIDVS
jgi:hypothetical protein